MPGAKRALGGGLLVLFAVVGCRSREPVSHGAGSGSAKPSAAPVAPIASARPVSPPRPPAPVGCRVLGVKASSPAPPGTPPVGTFFTGKAWLDLGAGVELSLKHSETTREFALRGPGRFLACADGDEAVLVARGAVATTPGPGSRAGAEVMLATPFGVVEYADAALTLTVGDDKLALDVKQGAAALHASVLEDRPGAPAPKPVHAPAGHLALSGKVDPAALAGRCVEARLALASGTAAAAPPQGHERGQWAVGLLEARRALRLTCARARAAIGRLEGPERSRLESQLTASKQAPPSGADPSAGPGLDAGR